MSQIRQPQLSLNENLVQHIGCAEGLVKLLAEEKLALMANDLDGLTRLCAAKAEAALTLQALSAQLNKTCGGDATVVASHIEKNGSSTQRRQWQDLLKLAARCQQANLENGALLLERQVRVRSMLQLMQRDEKPLYGRGGTSPLLASRRALALA